MGVADLDMGLHAVVGFGMHTSWVLALSLLTTLALLLQRRAGEAPCVRVPVD